MAHHHHHHHHHTTTTTEAAHTDRREFLRHLSLGTSVSACVFVAPEISAGFEPPTTPPKATEAEPPKDAKPTTPPPRQAPSELEAEIEARMGVILARFGGKLDDEARQAVRREVTIIVGRGRALRQIPLKNGEGPFPVFAPYRAPLA